MLYLSNHYQNVYQGSALGSSVDGHIKHLTIFGYKFDTKNADIHPCTAPPMAVKISKAVLQVMVKIAQLKAIEHFTLLGTSLNPWYDLSILSYSVADILLCC